MPSLLHLNKGKHARTDKADGIDDAKAHEEELARETEEAGADAYKFDPDASPEEKAAAARKMMPTRMNVSRKGPNRQALKTDMGAPPINPPDLPEPQHPELDQGSDRDKSSQHLIKRSADVQDIGWEKVGGGNFEDRAKFIDMEENKGLDDKDRDERTRPTMLETRLRPGFYGEWWHNAAIIVVAVMTSWLWGRWSGGIWGLIFVGAVCATYYRTSIRRTRRNLRDDINRLMFKRQLENDVESTEWINTFMAKFWVLYEPVLSATIVASVDQVLVENTPAFLDSMRLSTFTLGTKPPRIDSVKTYPKSEEDIVLMDWRFSFTPNDTADMTQRQLSNKVNPKVVLQVRVGKGFASAGLPILVSDFAFSGLMRVRIKLMANFPHIRAVDICFLERPNFDYVLKPLGGQKLGLDVANLPGLSTFIEEQIHGNLGPMFYAPNVFTVNVEQILSGAALDSALGVIQVTAYHARNLHGADAFSGDPDVYIKFSFNTGAEFARTDIKKNTKEPNWGETKYILCNSLALSLLMEIYDFNDVRSDKLLGAVTFDCSQFEHESTFENLVGTVLYNGKPRGELVHSIQWFPILKPKVLEDGSLTDPAPEAETGIVRLTIHQAKDLQHPTGVFVNSIAVLLLNGHEIHETKLLKKTNNPSWEDSYELLVANRSDCRLGLRIRDPKKPDDSMGTWQMMLNDLKDSNESEIDWFDLSNCDQGKVRISMQWKPIEMTGALQGAGGYVMPIGVARFHIRAANDIRNVEGFHGGKSDPYVKVSSNRSLRPSETIIIKGDLNPVWDEVVYVPVRKSSEKFTLEVMDYQGRTSGRSLGSTSFKISDIMDQDEQGNWLANSENQVRTEGLLSKKDRSKKGTLSYSVSLFPCLNVADPFKEEKEQNIKEKDHQPKIENTKQDTQENHKNSADIVAEAQDDLETKVDATNDSREDLKLHLTPEELMSYNSGLVVFHIMDGSLCTKGVYVEVLFDDNANPSYRTAKSRSMDAQWFEVGDGCVRDLKNSKMTIRLIQKSGSDDEPLAQISVATIDALKETLNNPSYFTLQTHDGQVNKIQISFKYIPAEIKLDPGELFENQGNLRVEILEGKSLPAGDRSGKSDPFVTLVLNSERVYKTKTVKKTLDPQYAEVTDVEIPSRLTSRLNVQVYDWDFGGGADKLGHGKVILRDLPIREPSMQDVHLNTSGLIRLRLVFNPAWVSRAKKGGSSTFVGGVFGAAQGLAGVPLKGAGMVGEAAVSGVGGAAKFAGKGVGGVGRGVGKGVGGVGKAFGFKKKKANEVLSPEQLQQAGISPDEEVEVDAQEAALEEQSVYSVDTSGGPSNAAAEQGRNGTNEALVGAAGGSAAADGENRDMTAGAKAIESGVYDIELMSGNGFPDKKMYVTARTSKKNVYATKPIKGPSPEWKDRFSASVDTTEQMIFVAKEHSKFGSDHDLGQGAYIVGDKMEGDHKLQLGDSGATLNFRSSFKKVDRPNSAGETNAGSSGGSRLSTSSSRKSLVSRNKNGK